MNLRKYRAFARVISHAAALLGVGSALFVMIGLSCCVSVAAAESAISPLPESDYTVRPVCAAPAPGYAGCLALELVPKTAAARARTHPLGITRSRPIVAAKASEGAFGLRPQDLLSVYQLPSTASSPQTIAIVDAYNDLGAEADLNTYSSEFGLSELTACTAGEVSKCFQQVNQKGEHGNLPFPASKKARAEKEATCEKSHTKKGEEACQEVNEADGWTGEVSLDIEVAHAVCQNCRIVLVETKSPSFSDLEEGENTAASLGATEISNSWGGPEQGITPATDNASSFNHPGIVITAAAGDDGYLDWHAKESFERGFADYPASSTHVVAVGGTRLGPLGPGGTWAGETVWNGDGAGGSGCSSLVAPTWQTAMRDWSTVGCGSGRAVADVSADADPYTGVAIYDSTPEDMGGGTPGWVPIGGTSLASPLVASVFALAGGANGVAYPAQSLYENEIENPISLHDVVSGSNGECTQPFNEEGLSGCTLLQEAASCSQEAICLAREGYDGPSGVGTPNGIAAFEPVSEEARRANEARRTKEQAEAKQHEEEHQSEAKKAEEERNARGGSSGGGTNGSGGATSGSSTTGVSNTSAGGKSGGSSGTTDSSSGAGSNQPTVKLTAFALTPTALLALNRTRPRVSSVHFAFTISAAARVHATLAKLVRVRGHNRWELIPGVLTLTATKGRNRNSLKSHRALTPGRYHLTLTPEQGAARTLTFQVG
jgi:hypothetical protein